jgi:putative ABC transport system ATP-binding protein
MTMMPDQPPALQLVGVHKRRRGPDGSEVAILRGIDLSIPPARLTAIVGPSGGGKSTLVRLLNRLEDPSSGRILFGGRDLAAIPPLTLRREIGLVLQTPFMFPGSVFDNLQRPFRFRRETPPAGDSPRLQRILLRCGLAPEFLSREARTLSVGQQQRVALARILLPGPQVLVLDEPTSALDRPTGDRLAETLGIICREEDLTVLMVTHDLRLAERSADFVAYLEEGRIIESGSAADLLKEPRTPELKAFLAGDGGGPG